MSAAQTFFGNSSYHNHYLQPSDDMYKAVQRGLPGWVLTRVQIARLPKARRTPQEIPWGHRASILRMNSGDDVVETDDRSRIKHERLRFDEPVRIGTFVYGTAPEEDDLELKERRCSPPHIATKSHFLVFLAMLVPEGFGEK